MRSILAVLLWATLAGAQQQPAAPCVTGRSNDGTVCSGAVKQAPPKAAETSFPSAAFQPLQPAAGYQKQTELNNQATFTLAPAIARTSAVSTYDPPPHLTPLQQTSDDFRSTAGYPLGAAMAREMQMHRARSFVKKFCKTYGSGAVWSYQLNGGDSIEGVCQ